MFIKKHENFYKISCLLFDNPVSCDNIDQYLNEPLQIKLPAHNFYSRNYPDFLDDKDAHYYPELCTVVGTVMDDYREKNNQETETAYNVNNHIYKMFRIVEKYIDEGGLEWVRDNKINEMSLTTNKKGVRPDVTVYYKDVLVMIGEEKDVHTKLSVASAELNNYFSFWSTLAFGDLPLVIGFAAGGTKLQFYYYHVIDLTNKPIRVEISDLLTFGTSNKFNNLKALQYTINIIRIIRTLDRDQVLKTPLLKLFNVIYRDNCRITITPTEVAKTIEKASIDNQVFHEKLYKVILPRLGHYEKINYGTSRNLIYLTLSPVGFSSIPKNENELRRAILDILEIANKLHNEGVVHRDICWDNIIKLSNGKWMLIDFEKAAEIGETRYSSNIN